MFKTSADPFVGKLSYFRVYGEALKSNAQLWNANKGESERVGANVMRFYQLLSGQIEVQVNYGEIFHKMAEVYYARPG